MIEADNVTGASVRGRGTIDGRGSEIRRRTLENGRPLINLVYAVGCQNLVFEGVTLLDSEFWSTHILLCEDVRFSFVKVINEFPTRGWAGYLGERASRWTWNNADGINPDSSQRVLIECCLLYTGDDCVPIKNTGTYKNILRDVRDVICRRSIMMTPVTAMKIGTETRGQFIKKIIFEDNLVVDCGRAIGVELKDGAKAGEIKFRNIRVRRCNRPFDFQIILRQDALEQLSFSVLEFAEMENVIIDRHAVDGEWFTSHIHGLDARHPIKKLNIRSCSVSAAKLDGTNFQDLDINEFSSVKFE